jgi:hypothetical protein
MSNCVDKLLPLLTFEARVGGTKREANRKTMKRVKNPSIVGYTKRGMLDDRPWVDNTV